MNAQDFGAFLAQTRHARGLTQAQLAEQLHITDKAVSRWERGIGLPDISLLEPLAEALGLSLADLMHCRDPHQQTGSGSSENIEDFFALLRSQQPVDWNSVRLALFRLTVFLAVLGMIFYPGQTIVVQWQRQSGGLFVPDGWMNAFFIFPLLVVFEWIVQEIWVFYTKASNARTSTWKLMASTSRIGRYLLQAADLFFFVCCGLTVPFCMMAVIVINGGPLWAV